MFTSCSLSHRALSSSQLEHSQLLLHQNHNTPFFIIEQIQKNFYAQCFVSLDNGAQYDEIKVVFIVVIHGIRNTWSSPKPSTIRSGNSQLIINMNQTSWIWKGRIRAFEADSALHCNDTITITGPNAHQN